LGASSIGLIIYDGDADNLTATSAAMPLTRRIRGADFNGDGKGDLLWRSQDASGNAVYEVWTMNGTAALQKSTTTLCGTGWRGSPLAIADFDNGGARGYVHLGAGMEGSVGPTFACAMQGVTPQTQTNLVSPAPYYSLIQVGDLNGDGKDDLLWRNYGSDAIVPGEPRLVGGVQVVFMDGAQVVSTSQLQPDNSGWELVDLGDLNGDGKADLLWRHTDGRVQAWLMDGANILGQADLRAAATGWNINFLGDFNGDGKWDILWEHDDGSAVMWTMDGLTMLQETSLGGPTSTGPYLLPAGDLNGDGKDDLLWQTIPATGSQTWKASLMDGGTIVSQVTLAPPAIGATITHAIDLNGDGKSDLIWRYTDGSVLGWIMNGLTKTTSGLIRSRVAPQVVPNQLSMLLVP